MSDRVRDRDRDRDRDRLPAFLVQRAGELGLRVAVAESLTGGMLAASIVSQPGASKAFSGGVIAYDTALKHSMLGVDAQLLRKRGPVDDEVARQMARGVRTSCAVEGAPAGLGISTTGVAGPEPDPQTGQAPGTVWVAVSTDRGELAQRLSGLGGLDRESIRRETVLAALELALQALADET